VVADFIVGTISNLGVVRIVIAVVLVGVGESVVGKELQSMREAPLHLDLERIVFAAGIVSKIVPLVGGTTLQDSRYLSRRPRKVHCRIGWIGEARVAKSVEIGPPVHLRNASSCRIATCTCAADD
jgi:hypothetical protein